MKSLFDRPKVTFTCYRYVATEGEFTMFKFWPDGVWDEYKYTMDEALEAYPPSAWSWIHAD